MRLLYEPPDDFKVIRESFLFVFCFDKKAFCVSVPQAKEVYMCREQDLIVATTPDKAVFVSRDLDCLYQKEIKLVKSFNSKGRVKTIKSPGGQDIVVEDNLLCLDSNSFDYSSWISCQEMEIVDAGILRVFRFEDLFVFHNTCQDEYYLRYLSNVTDVLVDQQEIIVGQDNDPYNNYFYIEEEEFMEKRKPQ